MKILLRAQREVSFKSKARSLAQSVLTLILGLVLCSSECNPTPDGYQDGTQQYPFHIKTAADLKQLAAEVNGGDPKTGIYFLQINDIALDIAPDGEGWEPIGRLYKPFKGHSKGASYKVTGLRITKPEESFVGLFGYLEGGSIQKLYVEIDEKGGVTGNSEVGGVVGMVENSSISECHTKGGAVAGNGWVGGVAGEVEESSITYCNATGMVSGRKC